jgi:OPT family small oligopeptide transporter
MEVKKNSFSQIEKIEEVDGQSPNLIRSALGELSPKVLEEVAPNGGVEYILSKIEEMSDEEALQIVTEAIPFHQDDWNFPPRTMDKLKMIVRGPEASGLDKLSYSVDLRMQACLLVYSSPYPEVRSIMDYNDDPTTPVETFRAYLLGLVWTTIGAGVNTFFNSRFPGISISGSVIQIFVYPCGMLLALILPDWGFTVAGTRHSLNPGPWSFKEQMFSTIVFTSGMSSFQAYSMIMVQKLDIFYGDKWVSFGYQILATLFFQFMGIGLAGIFRRIVVYPVKAIWPSSLYTIAMNRALMSHDSGETIHGWKMSRYKFFFVVFIGGWFYYWLPGYLFTAFSTFNWMTWIAPHNYNLAVITGSENGLGINPWTTFDWNVATAAFPSLTSPFYQIGHRFAGTVIGVMIIIGIFYSNYKYTGYLPPNSNSLFANDGGLYNVSRVTVNNLLNEEKYQHYSPPFLSAGKLVQAGASFVVYPMYFIYMMYDQWAIIKDGFVDLYYGLFKKRSSYSDRQDIHSRMMSKYPEAPDWWFIAVFILTLVIAIVCVKVYPVNIPVWFLFVIIGLSLVFMAPLLVLQAVTGCNFGLLYLMIIVAGYCLPGNANAQMMASLLGGWSIDGTTDSYVSNQKIAHYSGIPPRAIFRGQMLATLVTSFVAVGIEDWSMAHIANLCSPDQPQKFSCQGNSSGGDATFSSSVVWGLLGPKRIFSGQYPIFKWCFLMGFLFGLMYVILQWYCSRYGERIIESARRNLKPRTFEYLQSFVFMPIASLKWFNPVLILVGMQDLCPVNMSYCIPGFLLCYLFMYHIKNRYLAWWEKYNYVLAAAMYAAVAFCSIIIFFSVQYHPKPLVWWGNTVSSAGIDGNLTGYLRIPSQGYFGPSPGHYP